jgi:hypothetical protein
VLHIATPDTGPAGTGVEKICLKSTYGHAAPALAHNLITDKARKGNFVQFIAKIQETP